MIIRSNFPGAIYGLAIYNSIIIYVPFPLVLYKKLLGETVMLDDLQDLYPTLANSLKQLLEYPDEDVEDVSMFPSKLKYLNIFGGSYEIFSPISQAIGKTTYRIPLLSKLRCHNNEIIFIVQTFPFPFSFSCGIGPYTNILLTTRIL